MCSCHMRACCLCMSLYQASEVFEKMSVATGVHITTPQEALERIAQQGPREQQLSQEIETLEAAMEKVRESVPSLRENRTMTHVVMPPRCARRRKQRFCASKTKWIWCGRSTTASAFKLREPRWTTTAAA